MPSAEIYSGVAQGLGQVAQYNRERPEREARMAEATMRREKSMMELEEFKQQAPNRAAMSDVRLAQAEGELYKMRTAALQNDTFTAFKQFNAERQPRHLNTFLQTAKANPQGKNIWGNWARFDNVARTPETEAMLGQTGMTPEGIDTYFEDPSIANYVVGTDIQGQQSLVDMDKLAAATGYTRHMNQQELLDMKTNAQISQMLRGQEDANTRAIGKIQEENPGMGFIEAMNIFFDAKNSQRKTGSTIERTRDTLMEEDPSLSFQAATYKAKTMHEGRTSGVKDVENIQVLRDQLHALNPEEEGDFYDLDLSNPKVRARAGEKIAALEKLTGKRPSNEERRTARQLRSLLSLSTTAGTELTDDETGIIDNMFHGVKKYFSDNVEGLAGTTSYHSFRNVMRNALMGATLTKAELKAFDQAAGTLGQQLGPVLAALKTSMGDVQNQLRSLATDMDPMAAKYYLGMDLESAETAIDAVDERVRMIQDKEDLIKRGDDITVKQAQGQPKIAPKVKVVIPGPTVDGTKPAISASERFKQLQGNN